MTSCKACGAPLDGPLSWIAGFLGVKPSSIAPEYCNKCEDMALARTRVGIVKIKPAKRTKAKSRKKRK